MASFPRSPYRTSRILARQQLLTRIQQEIEAKEACAWLRAAGFPQYAQLYEDSLFPINIAAVKKDHDFLERDLVEPLFRRLHALNHCASMRLDVNLQRRKGDDSDEEDLCLSNKWTFQRTSRRWSRVDDPHTPLPGADGNGSPGAPEMRDAAIGQGVLADRRTDTLSARVAQGRLEGQGRASGQAISTPVLQQREPESFKAMSPHQESFKAKSQESFKAMSAQPESFKAMMQKQEPEFFKAMSQESFKAMSPHLESFKAMIQQQEPESFKAMMQQQEPESFKAMSPQRELESFKAMSQESFKAMLQEQESFKAMSPQQEPESFKAMSPQREQESFKAMSPQQEPESFKAMSPQREQESFKAMSPQREQESFKAMSPQQEPESFKAMSPQREQESFKAISLQPESFKAMSQESFKAMFPELESFKAISPQPESFKAMLPESFKAMSPHQESFKAMSQESFKAMMQQQEPESFKAKSQESFTAMMQQLEPEPESFKAKSQESFKAMSQESFKAMLRELESFKAMMQQPESFKAKSQESVKATPRPQVPNGHAPAPPRGTGRPGAASKRGGVYLEDLDVLSGAPGGRRGFRSQEDLLFLVPEDHTPGTFPKALSVESLSPAGGDGAGWRTAGHGEDSPPRAPRAGSRVSVYDNVPGSHLYASTGDLLDLERDGLLPGVGPILHPGTPPPGPSPPSPSPPDGRRAASPTGPSGRPSCLGPRPSPPPPPAARSIRGHTAAQLSLLRRLSLLRLTAIMERCSAGARGGRTWSVPKFMKRTRVPDPSAQGVFGVPLLVHVRRTGHPLPPGIQEALGHLRRSCLDQVGLFRRPGVRSRIHALRRAMEESEGVPGRACPPRVCYEDQSAYDVADLVKLFFRDLPEPLFTNKLRDSFLRVYRYVPEAQRLQAARAAVLLLPDEHREALHALLLLLADVVASARVNRMTPANLAVCLAPSLFHLNSPRVVPKKQAAGKPDPRDLSENMAAVQGLAHMIAECDRLFEVPHEMVAGSLTSYLEAEIHPPGLAEGGAALQASLERLVRGLQKEARERAGGWVTCSSPEEVDLAFKKVGFGPPLRLWRAAVEVTAPPSAVLRLLRERPAWGGDPARLDVLQSLDAHTEVIQFELDAMAPLPPTHCVVLRTWRTDLPKGACALVSLSVEHGDARPTAGVRAAVTESQYLIEPCGSGKSRLTHECRIDLRGRSPEWYSRAFGHLLASALAGVRDSFLPLLAEGPETKI